VRGNLSEVEIQALTVDKVVEKLETVFKGAKAKFKRQGGGDKKQDEYETAKRRATRKTKVDLLLVFYCGILVKSLESKGSS
jgi:hypothetical protein